MAENNTLQSIISHAKEYGFIFPSSEIYEGLSAVYDYGPLGVELKRNIKELWWKHMTQFHKDIVGIDSSIFMHPKVWKASGHVDSFNDPMIDNKDSKKRYRVDHLIEDHVAALPEEEKMLILERMEEMLGAEDLEGLSEMIEELKIVCPISKTANWTEIRQFNLMFSTKVGSVADEANEIYLRPETAQGIFVNFSNVQKTSRKHIPFGIAQIGKAFRNEIVARGFVFRMREFEQMEMQFFIRPGTQKEWYEYWKEERLKWHQSLGIPAENFRFHDHVQLSHYADMACDIEYKYPMGFRELEGIHSRTDFDLKNHQEESRKKLQYYDHTLNEDGKPYGNYIPYVLETSVGLDRLILMLMCHAYTEEDLSTEDRKDSRVVLKFHPRVAPIKLAILPLTRKDGLPEIAEQLFDDCKMEFKCFYEEKDTIGKRYRRMDALGTPFCVTIDHQTKEDDTVTIRYRDSMEQERIPVNQIKELVQKAIK
ncbi:MAG TPA: glycine--tRNA ligase [Chitinophagaceae bacterium]|nr:glycine--tRNA ligase [Chitinophagaceae bacterium]